MKEKNVSANVLPSRLLSYRKYPNPKTHSRLKLSRLSVAIIFYEAKWLNRYGNWQNGLED